MLPFMNTTVLVRTVIIQFVIPSYVHILYVLTYNMELLDPSVARVLRMYDAMMFGSLDEATLLNLKSSRRTVDYIVISTDIWDA